MQHVQVLALVLVDALDLDVEERRRVDRDAGALADAARERLLVGALDRAPSVLEGGVVGERLERAKPRQIGHPALADAVSSRSRARARVAEDQEAARRDAVGDVVEALGPELGEVPEHGLPQQLGMQRGDPVDRVAADGREVRHAHALVARLVDQRQARDARVVAGMPRPHLVEEAAVDLVDDLERPRQQAAEERQPPGLERLGQAACGWCRRACGG